MINLNTDLDEGPQLYRKGNRGPLTIDDLAKKLLAENPGISRDAFVEKSWHKATSMMKREAWEPCMAERYAKLKRPKKPEPTPEEKAAAAAAKQVKDNADMAAYKAGCIHLALAQLLIDGKPMSDCTNGELKQWGGKQVHIGSDEMTAGSARITVGKRVVKFASENGAENEKVGVLSPEQYLKLAVSVEDLRKLAA